MTSWRRLHYYEALSPQAADHFRKAFARAESEIADGLVAHQRVFEHYSRVFIGQFPYNVYYRLHGSRAVIVGVLYARFSPQRISDTLNTRGSRSQERTN